MTKTTETGSDPKKEISIKPKSLDRVNGILVYTTDAEDGTGFTLLVDDQKIKASTSGGQVWFYAGAPLEEWANIRLQ